MADQRVSEVVRVADATTLTQGLAVDSTGAASVNVAKVNGVATTTGNGVAGTGVQRVAVSSDNTPFPVKTDQTTHGTTDLVAADITKVAGAAISQGHGTAAAAIRVELPTDGTGVVALGTGSATIGALTANQSVNVAQANGVTLLMGNGVTGTGSPRVTIASDNTAIPVTAISTAPTNPLMDITNLTTPVNLAAGASGNADTADLAAKYLRQAVVSGSVQFKVTLATLSNGTATNKVVLFGGPMNPVIYTPPHQSYFLSGSTAGADGFRAAIVNLDTSETADFYASFAYADN